MKWIMLIIIMGFGNSTTEQVEFPTEVACSTARDAILAGGDYLPTKRWGVKPTNLRVYCLRRYGE